MKMKRKASMEPSESGGGRGAKRLRFSELSRLIVTDSKSREDVEEAWYSRSEIDQFRSNVQLASRTLSKTRTAKAMQHIAHSVATGSEQARIHIHSKEVIRGIEHLISPEALKFMLHERARHARRVLEEQQAQKRAGTTRDPASAARMRTISEIHSSFGNRFFERITDLQSSPEKDPIHSTSLEHP